MNYANIKFPDVSNGPGVRISLFVSGCNHKCKGCFNEEAWDFNYGKVFTKTSEDEIYHKLKLDYVDGITILGGEPLDHKNINYVYTLLRKIKYIFPNKSIWLYTGYLYENFENYDILNYIDVMVDGKFIEELYDINLKFKGSSNQRIIDVQKSIENKKIILL